MSQLGAQGRVLRVVPFVCKTPSTVFCLEGQGSFNMGLPRTYSCKTFFFNVHSFMGLYKEIT